MFYSNEVVEIKRRGKPTLRMTLLQREAKDEFNDLFDKLIRTLVFSKGKTWRVVHRQ